MIKVKNMIDEAMSKLISNKANSTDWELVYYEYYIDIIDEEEKSRVSKLLLEADINDEKIDVLKNAVKESKGLTKIMK